MKRLHIIYDADCQLCRQCRLWLGHQATFVPLHFIPLQSEELVCRFPGIERWHPEREIMVISDTGEVWQGGAAWVMCLWALREYREWSQRLAHPLLLPLARKACEMISTRRHQISRWFESESTGQLAQRLASETQEECGIGQVCPVAPPRWRT